MGDSSSVLRIVFYDTSPLHESLLGFREERIIILSCQDTALVNALQRKATVVLQKSIREGFGLTVAEAMWKGTPVIGGNVGGIRYQIENGENGFLVSSVEEAAKRHRRENRKRSKKSCKSCLKIKQLNHGPLQGPLLFVLNFLILIAVVSLSVRAYKHT